MRTTLREFIAVAALAVPAAAWSACIHMGSPVVCPAGVPDGSTSLFFSGPSTCWQTPASAITCSAGHTFTPFAPPAAPTVGTTPGTAFDVLALTSGTRLDASRVRAGSAPGYEPLPRDDFLDVVVSQVTVGGFTNVGDDFDKRDFIWFFQGEQQRRNEERVDRWEKWHAGQRSGGVQLAAAEPSGASPAELRKFAAGSSAGASMQQDAANRIAGDLMSTDPARQERGKNALEFASAELKDLVSTTVRTQYLAAGEAASDALAYNAAGSAALVPPNPSPIAVARDRMERFYTGQVAGYTQQLHDLNAQRDAAKEEKRNAEAKLDGHLKGQDWTGYLSGVVAGDPQAEYLAKQVATADQRIALTEIRIGAAQQQLDNTLRQRESLSNRLELEAIKADPARLAREQGTRYDTLIAASQDFATKQAQFRAGEARFKALIAGLDALIDTFKAIGQPDGAAAFEQEKRAVLEVHDAWSAGMRTASANRAAEINRQYARNARDGIGPGNNSELLAQMDAYGKAGDSRAIVTLVDKDAVARAAGSAFTTGARVSAADPHAYTGWDFASDTATTYIDAYRDPKTFVIRNAYYWKGVGTAVKDGVTDIVVLAANAADLAGESIEAVLGVDTGLFGREESEALQKLLQGASEMDSTTLYRITDTLITRAERRLEQTAGSGEKGVRDALSDTGYVVGTVAGGEELAFKAVAYAGKLRALAASLRAAGKADEAAQAGALAKVYDGLADAARAGEDVTVATPPPMAGRLQDATPTVSGGIPPASALPASPSTNLVTGANQRPTLLRGTDGTEYPVGELLGAGLTSNTYAVPGRNAVVKITEKANPLDDYGFKVIDSIDPGMNAKLIDRQVIDGKTVSVFERADPFSVGRKSKAEAAGVAARDIDMTPGQVSAYRESMAKLNANGYIWLDAKPNNYAFVPIEGKADQFRLVIIDPGGIVPMKDPSDAFRAQRFMDAPDDAFLQDAARVSPEFVSRMARERMEVFSDAVDVERLNQEAGMDVQDIFQIPFNAENGLHSPGLRNAVRTGSDPFRDAPTQVDLAARVDDVLTTGGSAPAENYLRTQGLSEKEIREYMNKPIASTEEVLRRQGMSEDQIRDYMQKYPAE